MATAKKNTEAVEATEALETAKEEQKKVQVMIFKNEAKEEDQVVGINGVFTTIRKGEYVDIPESHAEVLRHAQELRQLNRKIVAQQK